MATQTPLLQRVLPTPHAVGKTGLRRWFPTTADLLVLPYALFLLAFGVLPGIYALVLSFAAFPLGTPQYFAAGLQNYATALHDFRFVPAFVNIFQFLIISVPFGVIGVTGIALLLHARSGRFSEVMRTIYFLGGWSYLCLACPVHARSTDQPI